MTDQPLSEDELASAALDGEPTGPRPVGPGDQTRIDARVDELRHAADAIAAPVIVDDSSRERAIAAALDAFDRLPATETETEPSRPMRFLPALAAAAAVVLVLVGVVAVVRHDDSPTADTASGAEAASGAATAAAGLAPTTMADRASANDAARQGAAAPAAATASARDLGGLSDPTALRTALGPDAFTDKAAQLEPTQIECEAEARAGAGTDLGTLTDDATLQWKGQAARALVFVDAASASHIVVVADPSCAVLDLID